jgi:hypothetical protein
MSPSNTQVNPHNCGRPKSAIPTPQSHAQRDGSAMKSKTYIITKTKPFFERTHLSIEGAANVFTVTHSPAGGSRLSARIPRGKLQS